jgi:uncharacterized membrane protein YphA (DoxX/SURF4 family)
VSALRHRGLHWLIGVVLGAVFIYASLDKIRHPGDFARIVYHYQVIGPSQRIPPVVPNLFAVTLPWVEAVAGLALLTGLWRREAAAVAAVMLLVFMAAVGSALQRGIDIEKCGCFSVSEEGRRAGVLLFVEDAAMLAGALVLTLRPRAAATAPGPAAEAAAAASR